MMFQFAIEEPATKRNLLNLNSRLSHDVFDATQSRVADKPSIVNFSNWNYDESQHFLF